MRNWTPEAIRRWQPWKNSIGPKTEGGKARTRMNAEKHGQYNARDIASRREMRKILGRQMQFLKSVRLSLRLQKKFKNAGTDYYDGGVDCRRAGDHTGIL